MLVPELAVRQALTYFFDELLRCELVNVEGVAGGVDARVRGRDQEDALGGKDPDQLIHRLLLGSDVLQGLETHDKVECGVLPGDPGQVALDELRLWNSPLRIGDGLRRDVETLGTGRPRPQEPLRAPPHPTPGVEDTATVGQLPGQGVPSDVLGLDELASHRLGYESLAGCFGHALTALRW